MSRTLAALALAALALAGSTRHATAAQPAGLFNPGATLDTTQVQDRRMHAPVTMVADGWTCTLAGDDSWHCMPPGMTA